MTIKHLKKMGFANKEIQAIMFDCTDDREMKSLARILSNVFTAYSRLFRDMPYNMMYHNFPNSELWHFHLEIYPRLVTHAGFEFFGLNVNVVPPETAAKTLRDALLDE